MENDRKAVQLNDSALDQITGAGDGDNDGGGVILIRPDGPYADTSAVKMPGMVKYSNVTLKRG